MIRGPSDAADAGDVTKGLSKAPAALPHCPGWTVVFSALVTPPLPWTVSRVLYFMVHLALSCTRPPPSSPCGIPSRQDIWGDEDQDIYKRRRGDGWFWERSRALAIVAIPSSTSSVTCNLSKKYKPPKQDVGVLPLKRALNLGNTVRPSL